MRSRRSTRPGWRARVADAEDAARAIRMLSVMSLADGEIDAEKTALVRAYADALGRRGRLPRHPHRGGRRRDRPGRRLHRPQERRELPPPRFEPAVDQRVAPFFPYKEAADPELEARYKTLGELPADTFGHAFFDHFHKNGFFFPGNPNGLAEGFTTPHDSSHVLSGYSTSEGGEICVSTFIGAMHPDHPMAAEVLPVIFSWHLGVKLNDIANSTTGVFEPRHFWTAWERGSQGHHRRRRRRLGLLGRDERAAGGTARRLQRAAGRPGDAGVGTARVRALAAGPGSRGFAGKLAQGRCRCGETGAGTARFGRRTRRDGASAGRRHRDGAFSGETARRCRGRHGDVRLCGGSGPDRGERSSLVRHRRTSDERSQGPRVIRGISPTGT